MDSSKKTANTKMSCDLGMEQQLSEVPSQATCGQLDASVEDVSELTLIGEDDMMSVFKARFDRGMIYTRAASVMVSINPFRPILFEEDGIYNIATQEIYAEALGKDYLEILSQVERQKKALPPHIYEVGMKAYKDMLIKRPQSVVISGESGAGKSESVKILLRFLVTASGILAQTRNKVPHVPHTMSPVTTIRLTIVEGGETEIEKRILESFPVLEAFGNAKTVHNDNSSRFGKWLKIYFGGPSRTINTASIDKFLLEKSRVTQIANGERTYHVLYYMVYGCSEEEKARYQIKDPEMYNSLRTPDGKLSAISTEEAQAGFSQLKDCMAGLNIREEEAAEIFKVLSAILSFGNLRFRGVDKAVIDPRGNFCETISSLLSVNADVLETCLCNKEFAVLNSKQMIHLLQIEAESNAQALARSLYGRLFDKIVMVANTNIGATVNDKKDEEAPFIGLLDIFGFENFATNSFEQLCINYVNEKVHNFLIGHIFKMEVDLYNQEGIKYSQITFQDNAAIIELMDERQPLGIFHIVNEASVQNFTKDDMVSRSIKSTHASSLHLDNRMKDSKIPEKFVVRHTAADVIYTVNGFIEKNRDKLPALVTTLLAESSGSPFVRSLMEDLVEVEEVQGKSPRANKKLDSLVLSKFTKDIRRLMDSLGETNPHFIHCIKSNRARRPVYFQPDYVSHQIRYLGIFDACKVRRSGFLYREPFEVFYLKYCQAMPLGLGRGVVYNPVKGEDYDFKKLSMSLIGELWSKYFLHYVSEREFGEDMDHYIQYGQTLIFLRQEIIEHIEDLREKHLIASHEAAIVIKKHLSRFFHQKTFQRSKRRIVIIQAHARCWKWYHQFKNLKRQTIKLQSHIRGRKYALEYQKLRASCVRIQIWWIKTVSRFQCQNYSQALRFLRVKTRGFVRRGEVLRALYAAKVLQRSLRLYSRRRSLLIAKHTISQRLVGAWRGKKWRDSHPKELERLMIARKQRVLVRFANWCKGRQIARKVRQAYLTTRSAIVKIQEWWLTILLSQAFWEKKYIVLYLQALSRGHLVRKRIRSLPKRVLYFQALWKGYLIRQRFLLLLRSAIIIQRHIRGKQRKLRFLALKKHVPRVQACIRGYLTRIKFEGQLTSQQMGIEKDVTLKAQKRELEMIKLKFNKCSEDHPFGWNMPFTSDVIEEISCYKWENGWVSTVSRLSAQLPEDEHVVTIALGRRHSIILTNKNRLLSIGDHDSGQLGRPLIDRPIIDISRLLAVHEIQRPRRIATSWKIAEICCGDEHTLMRCQDGVVFGWGSNKYGQLGLGHFEPVVPSPAINPYLLKKEGNPAVISLRSGACYGVALMSTGTVYTWGWGKALGLGPLPSPHQHMNSPKRVRGLCDAIKQVECGLGFTLALAYTGLLYGWGSNSCGQLGVENGKARLQPLVLHALQNEADLVESISKIRSTTPSSRGPLRKFLSRSESSLGRSRRPFKVTKHESFESPCPSVLNKVERISCGAFHSAAIMKSGRLFVWGRNTHGELGMVQPGRFSMPLGETGATEVACGARQTFAVSTAGVLYGWGRLYLSANSSVFEDNFSPVLFPADKLPKALVGKAGAHDKSKRLAICQEVSLQCKWSRSLSVGIFAVDDGRSHYEIDRNRNSIVKACNLKPEEYDAIMVAGLGSAEDHLERDFKEKLNTTPALPPWVTRYMPSKEDGVEMVTEEKMPPPSQALNPGGKRHHLEPTSDFVSALFDRDTLLSSIASQRSKKPRNPNTSKKPKRTGKYRLCLELKRPLSSDNQKPRRYVLTLEVDEVPPWALANPDTKFLKVTWSSAMKGSQKPAKYKACTPPVPKDGLPDAKHHRISSTEDIVRESQRLTSKLASSAKCLSKVQISDLWLQTSLAASAEPILLRKPQVSPSSIKRDKRREISKVHGASRAEPEKTISPQRVPRKKNPSNDLQLDVTKNRATGNKGPSNRHTCLSRKSPVPTFKRSHQRSINCFADQLKGDACKFSQPTLALKTNRTDRTMEFDPICASGNSLNKGKEGRFSRMHQKHSLLSNFLSRFGQPS